MSSTLHSSKCHKKLVRNFFWGDNAVDSHYFDIKKLMATILANLLRSLSKLFEQHYALVTFSKVP